MSGKSNFMAKVGPLVVVVAGGSIAAASTATVIVAIGAEAALSMAGYGLFKWFSGKLTLKEEKAEPAPTNGDHSLKELLIIGKRLLQGPRL